MKRKGVFFVSLILMVSLLAGSIAFAHANESEPDYVLSVGDLTYGAYKDTGETFWCGAPGDDGYISNGIVTPGSKYPVAMCFTMPADGKIDTTNGAGSIKLQPGQGDGARLSVFLNNDKIFPKNSLWVDAPVGESLSIAFGTIDVKQGDKLYYIVDNGGNNHNNWWDAVELVVGFHVSIGEQSVWFDSASCFWTDRETDGNVDVKAEFPYKKRDIMSYHYITINQVPPTFGALAYGPYKDTGETFWCGAPGDDGYISAGNIATPGSKYGVAMCFTMPADGKIDTTNGAGSIKLRSGEGDGVRFSVFLNNDKIFPADASFVDAPVVAPGGEPLSIAFGIIDVKQGDKLYYIVDNGGKNHNNWYDSVELVVGFHVSIGEQSVWFDSASCYWTDRETDGNVDVKAAFPYKKRDIMSYHYMSYAALEKEPIVTENKQVYLADGDFIFTNLEGSDVWTGAPSDKFAHINAGTVAPGSTYAVAVAFTAPCDGRISNAVGNGSVYRSGEEHDYTDKTRISVVLNQEVMFPYVGIWQDIPQGESNKMNILYNSTDVSAGDKLYYIVDNGGNGNSSWDMDQLEMKFLWKDAANPDGILVDALSNYWTSTSDGNKHVNFGAYKKSDVFSYHYMTVKEVNEVAPVETDEKTVRLKVGNFEYVNLNDTDLWGGVKTDNDTYVNGDSLSAGKIYATAIAFTAPSDGRISNALGCGSVFRSGEAHDYTDKTRISVVVNSQVVFPYRGVWQDIAQGAANKMDISFNSVDVRQGDKLYYIIENGGNGNSNWDINKLEMSFLWKDAANPNGILVDALSNYWTNEAEGNQNVNFGSYKKSSVFTYHYLSVNECNPVGEAQEYDYQDLAESPEMEKLNYSKTQEKYYMLGFYDIFAFEDFCQPGVGYALGFEWTAPSDGRIDLAGSFVENYSYISKPDTGGLISNGVTFRIVINGTRQIYPSDSASILLNSNAKYFIDLKPFAVQENDKVMFVLDCNEECNYDLCRMIADIKFAKTGEDYTETYNSFSDFKPESDNADAWAFYGIMTDALKENGGNTDGELSDILEVKYGMGGCGAALTPQKTFVGVGVLTALLLLSYFMNKRFKKKSK